MRLLSQEDLMKEIDPRKHSISIGVKPPTKPFVSVISEEKINESTKEYKEYCQRYKVACLVDYIKNLLKQGIPLDVVLSDIKDWISAYDEAKEQILKELN